MCACVRACVRACVCEMEADVTVSIFTSPSFSVTIRLRQGCTITPTLFALYLNQVIESLWGCCKAQGVKVFYKYGGKLED